MQAARHRAPALALGTVLLLGVAGCGGEEQEQPREGVSTRELTGDLSGDFDIDDAQVGDQQSLRVTVDEVLGPSAFTTTQEDAAGRRLLVVGPERGVEPGQVVQAVGLLRVFSYDDLDADHDLGDRSLYADREGDLVLVADTVDTDIPQDGQ